MPQKKKQIPTLCFRCRNAVPVEGRTGCSWSVAGDPVEGWTARGTKRGYYVFACPEFKPGSERLTAKDIDDDAARELAGAIVAMAARDYNRSCRREAEYVKWRPPWRRWDPKVMRKPKLMIQCEVFFTSGEAEAFSDADPRGLMNTIRRRNGLSAFISTAQEG